MNRKQHPGKDTPKELNDNLNGDEGEASHSVSRAPQAPQPIPFGASAASPETEPIGLVAAPDGNESIRGSAAPGPSAHVVLYQPEIPQNTGNIGRTCVAVGAKLWIVRPAAFRIDDARLRRAGLDYWEHLELGDAANWQDLLDQLAPRRMFFFSRFAKRTIWDVDFQQQDVFVFGRETSGLPASILDPEHEHSLRIPTTDKVRSLNLATSVGIVLYEQQRQFAGKGEWGSK